MKDLNSHFAIAIFWFLLVTFLLSLPGSEFPKITWLTKIWFDKWVHIILFFLLVIAWCLAFFRKIISNRIQIIFLQIAFLCFFYGVVMELVQHFFIPYRSFEVGDIIADGIGSFSGYAFASRRYIKK